MLPVILAAFIAAMSGGDDSSRREAQLLLDTIESLQQPVDDFRCEFEGTIRFRERVAEAMMVKDDEVFEFFSGVCIWKKGGQTHLESWHRLASSNQIRRDSVILRTQQRQAEYYSRFSDASIGNATVSDPKDVRTGQPGMSTIFLLDRMKREVADPGFDASVSDDQVDGRPLKVLNLALSGLPGSLMFRYWIDLKRSGHVVRQEDYFQAGSGRVMGRRLEIALKSFEVGGTEVWMPVFGDAVGYVAMVDKQPTIMKKPQALETTYVVDGTMEFNKHPGPEVFTIKYKPGTPVSDNLRKVAYEFGQQKVGPNPKKSDVEGMLREQLAEAEKQKSILVVASTSEASPWFARLAWVFGALVLICSIALWNQRRGH